MNVGAPFTFPGLTTLDSEKLDLEKSVEESLRRLPEAMDAVTIGDGDVFLDIAVEDPTCFTGNDPNIMVIPGNQTIQCRPILVGISSSRGGPKRSAKAVIKRMQEIIIECSPAVKVAIFVSDAAGMGRVLEENLGMFSAHLNRGNLKAFFPVMSVGQRLTVVNWKL